MMFPSKEGQVKASWEPGMGVVGWGEGSAGVGIIGRGPADGEAGNKPTRRAAFVAPS